jgi:gamma-glutamylcyclotransferase (GGCT)/AIG2-like uncharacterized protein YtfP
LAETNKLFVYGTLLLDDVISAVIGRIPHHQNAVAPGWQVVRLPQRVYPGLIPGRGEAVGKVFTDLANAEWSILDAFEDSAYTLAIVSVRLTSETVTNALSYIWRGEHIDQPWSLADFGRDELIKYLDRCRSWRRRYDENTS